ncbi:WXG100 family type VII secretion target [Terrabacter sp. 2RAF25]|uniref:WXG100 family type VII secretion target n=1 Tax=Terrabacter sp. 2RAF25 TaxID=3232998 RepID=UPI003F993114
MLYRKGADPEALERTARELTACAGEVDGIRATGTRALAALGRSWGGDDAQAAQETWRSASSALVALGSSLDSMSRRLAENARAQRGASGHGQASLPPWLAPGFGASSGPGGGTVDELDFADDVRGTEPHDVDLELAELAKGVYDGTGTDSFDPVSADELEKLGIDPASLTGRGGFQANIYRDDHGRYVLAFAGTDPKSVSDWGTNAQQGLGALSSQHLQAIALAHHLAAAVGSDNVVLTGHSLGGGLASTASVATGVPAVTFNAAGVHPNTVVAAAALGHHSASLDQGQVRNYHVRGEILTTVQNPLGSFVDHVPFIGDDPLPNALGTQIALDPAKGPDVHVSPWSMVSPVVGLVDTAIDLGSYSVGQHGAPSVIEAMEASEYFGKS